MQELNKHIFNLKVSIYKAKYKYYKKLSTKQSLLPPNYYLLKKFLGEKYFNKCWCWTDPSYRFEFLYLSDEDIPSEDSTAYDFLKDPNWKYKFTVLKKDPTTFEIEWIEGPQATPENLTFTNQELFNQEFDPDYTPLLYFTFSIPQK